MNKVFDKEIDDPNYNEKDLDQHVADEILSVPVFIPEDKLMFSG